ncbi:hypothetical protein AURDEDRAFT_171387 [Auricularia subglabra TFB-10046 SS5]|uniref:Uncharacterized protein n=1 Tax=Auricularia subglabra (strain TFB-10046 / SS5) TaxID=717982 RepID=J0D1E8_AURST|nr:hypothetical protein AURDEDRAFT_171387 [Auricularia subglabra TFB-10046 SS5]
MDGSPVSQSSAQFANAQDDAGPCSGLGASPALDEGQHTMLLAVVAEADKEFRFFGGVLTLGVNTKRHSVRDNHIIDDRDPGWNLNGGRIEAGGTWATAPSSARFNGSDTYECNYGPEVAASYKFSGAGGFILYGVVWEDSHSFTVSLDDTSVRMDASSSYGDGIAVLFGQGDLDPAADYLLTVFD